MVCSHGTLFFCEAFCFFVSLGAGRSAEDNFSSLVYISCVPRLLRRHDTPQCNTSRGITGITCTYSCMSSSVCSTWFAVASHVASRVSEPLVFVMGEQIVCARPTLPSGYIGCQWCLVVATR